MKIHSHSIRDKRKIDEIKTAGLETFKSNMQQAVNKANTACQETINNVYENIANAENKLEEHKAKIRNAYAKSQQERNKNADENEKKIRSPKDGKRDVE